MKESRHKTKVLLVLVLSLQSWAPFPTFSQQNINSSPEPTLCSFITTLNNVLDAT